MKKRRVNPFQLKRELKILIVCIFASFALNVYSILKSNNDLREFFQQLHVLLFISIILYILVGMFRLLYFGLKQFTNKSKK